ncbi:MAG: hypothetical protein IT377_09970 [Polyangiaceae bacterium]|nr:hypothetical protein [Polyangiaceae bacterium]
MSLKKQFKRKHDQARPDTETAEWPMGEEVHFVIDLSGGSRTMPYDDCPICRALQEAGEEVITINLDPFEN